MDSQTTQRVRLLKGLDPDRRGRVRFPVSLEVRYSVIGQRGPAESGPGRDRAGSLRHRLPGHLRRRPASRVAGGGLPGRVRRGTLRVRAGQPVFLIGRPFPHRAAYLLPDRVWKCVPIACVSAAICRPPQVRLVFL